MQVAGSATIVECICQDPTLQSARRHGICTGISTGLGGAVGFLIGSIATIGSGTSPTGLIIGGITGSSIGCLTYLAVSAYRNDGCSIRCRRITEADDVCRRHLPVTDQPGSTPVLQGLLRADEDAGSHSYPPIISMQPPPYEERDSRSTLTAPANPPPAYQRNTSASDGEEEIFSETGL